MKDSIFIKYLKRYKVSEYESGTGAKCVAFFMSPKQWTMFRKMFNKIESEDK
jgi:hypothetical protein